jgi:hypothetical protein
MNPADMSGDAAGGGSQDDMLLQYLMEMGALKPQEMEIARQRQMVDALRGQSQVPTGALNQGGRGFTPARSPLETLAPVMGQIGASLKERDANKMQGDYQTQRSGILRNMLARGKKPGSPDAGPLALGGPAAGELQQLG